MVGDLVCLSFSRRPGVLFLGLVILECAFFRLPLRSAGDPPLLHGMGQFVREQPIAVRRSGLKPIPCEMNISAHGERERIHPHRGFLRIRPGVKADGSQ
jgi:hypothetical protein